MIQYSVYKMKWIIMFFLVMCGSSIHLSAQPDTSFHLYLLIGQSNMSGRGVITDEYKNEGNANVLMLDQQNNWVQAKHPLHFDKPDIAGVGPGLSFGIEMSKEYPGEKIGLIPCAVGGSPIDAWQPGAYHKGTKTHPYDDMMKRLKLALQSGKLEGIIWLQGEADSSPEKAAVYLGKLTVLINRIRKEANNDCLPFVAAELGRYKEQYKNINKVLKKLPKKVSCTAVASSKGLTDKGDKTHFDSPSATIMGLRFAEKMKKIKKKCCR